MFTRSQLFLLILIIATSQASLQSKLKFYQYCTYHGYPVQEHIIRTQDGYNLKFFRVQKKNTTIVQGLKVVYLQHGFTDTSDTWIVNDQNLAPGFYFANRGYDVWFGNNRGNKYSSPAITPGKRDYWDFTFDQMAEFDLPAAFKYISNKTNSKINYVGHSQGTMIMFIALIQKYQHVQQNLNSYSALGPVAYLTNMNSVLKSVSKTNLPTILKKSNVNQILMLTDSQYQLQYKICAYDPIVCTTLLAEISQMNVTVDNLKRLPVIMGHFPSGASTKNLKHFQQLTNKPQFKKFDYGQKINLLKYGTSTPPFYNFKNIDFPVHLFVGKYDKLANMIDAKRAYDQMTNSRGKTFRQLDFGHATFCWGKDMSYLEEVVKIFENSREADKKLESVE